MMTFAFGVARYGLFPGLFPGLFRAITREIQANRPSVSLPFHFLKHLLHIAAFQQVIAL